jgi:urease accessory protein
MAVVTTDTTTAIRTNTTLIRMHTNMGHTTMNTRANIEALQLTRLLQLASPLLPVGAYSYSQGLEWAIDTGAVHDAATAGVWIGDCLEFNLARFELPLVACMRAAWDSGDIAALTHWNTVFCSGRDCAEARAETLQMGYSLVRLLEALDIDDVPIEILKRFVPVSFPLAYACAASIWKIPATDSLLAYAWSWAENQVSAALKTVPLGQVAGQRLLLTLGERIPRAAEAAASRVDVPAAEVALSNFAPGLAIAGARHETQYSRLFRS